MALYKPYHLVSNDVSNQEELLWCWREQRSVFYTTDHQLTFGLQRSHVPQQKGFTLSQHRDLPDIFQLITSHKASCYSFSDCLVLIKVYGRGASKSLSQAKSFPHRISASLHPPHSQPLRGEWRFLGSGQDWGLGDIESTLVSRGASHHQLAGNTIW